MTVRTLMRVTTTERHPLATTSATSSRAAASNYLLSSSTRRRRHHSGLGRGHCRAADFELGTNTCLCGATVGDWHHRERRTGKCV
jgi:hypothetical protein